MRTKALRELINKEGVAEVTTIEERRVKMRRNSTMEHCFENEETRETTRRRKTPRWFLCTFKERRKYMKRMVYLKLLKDTFATKKYSKGLLIQIKEEEVYKILTIKNSQMKKTAIQKSGSP